MRLPFIAAIRLMPPTLPTGMMPGTIGTSIPAARARST
jgi:hypothetical protein